jgi:CheY-like chemotaxis protein
MFCCLSSWPFSRPKARSLHPDVILLDLVMPRKDGIEAIGEIVAQDPDARILVLTSFAEDEGRGAGIPDEGFIAPGPDGGDPRRISRPAPNPLSCPCM